MADCPLCKPTVTVPLYRWWAHMRQEHPDRKGTWPKPPAALWEKED